MTRGFAAVLIGMGILEAALPLRGADSPRETGSRQSFAVTKTERVAFQPGGAVEIENSYGYLTVEGWDEPAVEITVAKSTNRFLTPDRKEEAGKRFDRIHVVTERRSDKELAISTTLPARHNLISSVLPSRRIVVTMPKHSHEGVTVEYTVHVPRDSRVIIRQDNGYVWVSDVTGDIQVESHTGDMIVMLPDPGSYSIDARTGMGSVSSDLAGNGHKRFLIGTRFAYASPAPSRQIHLRMGRGSITIKSGAPSGPFWKD
jgi:hypothetical protein